MGKGMSANEKAGILGIAGGILMLIAGLTGAVAWRTIGEMTVEFTQIEALGSVFQILVILGSLGGFLVMLGGLLFLLKLKIITKETRVKVGKILIAIGAGFGLLSLIIFIVLALFGENPLSSFFGALGIGFAGLILSIAARATAQ